MDKLSEATSSEKATEPATAATKPVTAKAETVAAKPATAKADTTAVTAEAAKSPEEDLENDLPPAKPIIPKSTTTLPPKKALSPLPPKKQTAAAEQNAEKNAAQVP